MVQPLNVSLPADLQRCVEDRVAAQGYADPADVLLDLIQRDQDTYEADVERLQRLIDEGIASGIIDSEPEDVLRQIIAETADEHG